LNKFLLYILLFFSVGTLAQGELPKRPSLRSFQETYKYVKNKKYFGPSSNYNEPESMDPYEEDETDYGYQGLQYSKEDIERSRSSKVSPTGRGASSGNKKYDPNISEPEDLAPWISPFAWKVILIVLGALLLAWIAYLVLKNYQKTPEIISDKFDPTSWNPALIPKTELELRLEAAMEIEDYRECVRIYFTFILKELIRLRKIKWQKERTNFDYLLQLSGKAEFIDFQESVRIYDLIWYGEYTITKSEYDEVVPHLASNYFKLVNENE